MSKADLAKDIPMQTGDKELDSQVEEMADYFKANCTDDMYKAIVLFGKSRYLQGSLNASRESIERIETDD